MGLSISTAAAAARAMPKTAFALAAAMVALPAASAAGGEIPPPLPAIGRITYETPNPAPGAAMCTGTLVAPDLVLTAAHCLPQMLPARFHFAAGFDGREARARRLGRRVILPDSGAGPPGDARDVALLVLDRPVAAEEAEPLPLGAPPRAEVPFHFVGHRRGADAEPAAASAACFALGFAEGVLALTCGAASGNSGSPVLGLIDGTWHVLAVMSGVSDRGLVQSVAAVPPPEFVAEIGARLP